MGLKAPERTLLFFFYYHRVAAAVLFEFVCMFVSLFLLMFCTDNMYVCYLNSI